jgi:hypothetical protein
MPLTLEKRRRIRREGRKRRLPLNPLEIAV